MPQSTGLFDICAVLFGLNLGKPKIPAECEDSGGGTNGILPDLVAGSPKTSFRVPENCAETACGSLLGTICWPNMSGGAAESGRNWWSNEGNGVFAGAFGEFRRACLAEILGFARLRPCTLGVLQAGNNVLIRLCTRWISSSASRRVW